MALFRAGAERAAPLLIQITAGEKQVEILGWWAYTEGISGPFSRPILTRPSRPGVSTLDEDVIEALDSPGVIATAEVLTRFTFPPSLPSPDYSRTSFPFPLLFETRWEMGGGVIVPPGECVLLYAQAAKPLRNEVSGVEWTGQIEWREL